MSFTVCVLLYSDQLFPAVKKSFDFVYWFISSLHCFSLMLTLMVAHLLHSVIWVLIWYFPSAGFQKSPPWPPVIWFSVSYNPFYATATVCSGASRSPNQLPASYLHVYWKHTPSDFWKLHISNKLLVKNSFTRIFIWWSV